MSASNPYYPAQAKFDEGIALINKGLIDEGEARLLEAAQLGHPYANKAIRETRLIHKVINMASAGLRNLAAAYLEETRWQPSPPPEQLVKQLREQLTRYKEEHFTEPTNKEGWLNMGVTVMEAGKQKIGIHCFMKAIELDGNYEIAWLNLGLAYAKFNEFEKALPIFDRLLGMKPDSFHGWHFKGMALGNLKRQEEAVDCYDRALKIKPDLTEAWYNKSLALGHLERHEECLRCCDRALEFNLHHLEAMLQKAKALYRLGRDAEAQACGERMKEIDPIGAEKLFKGGKG